MLNTQFFSALWLDQNNGNKKMEFDDVNKYNWIMVDALIVKQPPLPMKFWRDSRRYVHSIHVMFSRVCWLPTSLPFLKPNKMHARVK